MYKNNTQNTNLWAAVQNKLNRGTEMMARQRKVKEDRINLHVKLMRKIIETFRLQHIAQGFWHLFNNAFQSFKERAKWLIQLVKSPLYSKQE